MANALNKQVEKVRWMWCPQESGCGSKPMGSHFGVGAPPILEPILVGIEMFTGGTGLLTHGQVSVRVFEGSFFFPSAKEAKGEATQNCGPPSLTPNSLFGWMKHHLLGQCCLNVLLGGFLKMFA